MKIVRIQFYCWYSGPLILYAISVIHLSYIHGQCCWGAIIKDHSLANNLHYLCIDEHCWILDGALPKPNSCNTILLMVYNASHTAPIIGELKSKDLWLMCMVIVQFVLCVFWWWMGRCIPTSNLLGIISSNVILDALMTASQFRQMCVVKTLCYCYVRIVSYGSLGLYYAMDQ